MLATDKNNDRTRITEILDIIMRKYNDSLIEAPQSLVLELRELCNKSNEKDKKGNGQLKC
ncbi:hypothetical protein FP435_04645 [Lactobacillus sp. PV037]|uniref:hypothetical protein n=1 Tax=Lactobacillus sp. PV037 TaxID=2594496 RepID=UPI00223FC27E|nr:hypothetical protein [Lactobacillus sp. PV037]QNQ83780.1 hypothetical protein FP435_04645 [Lactobacillus sp. PV037]